VRQFLIPETFFKSIAEKGNLYSRLWMYWLGEFVDEIMEADFIEKQVKIQSKYIKESEIREIYHYGIQFLSDFKIVQTKKSKPSKIVSKENKEAAEKIIEYLNVKTGSTFSAKGSNLDLIAARLNEGYTYPEFQLVIDKKVADWKGSDYEKYLRPLTLFSKHKFENYLNTNNGGKSTNFQKFSESVQRAKELIGIHNN